MIDIFDKQEDDSLSFTNEQSDLNPNTTEDLFDNNNLFTDCEISNKTEQNNSFPNEYIEEEEYIDESNAFFALINNNRDRNLDRPNENTILDSNFSECSETLLSNNKNMTIGTSSTKTNSKHEDVLEMPIMKYNLPNFSQFSQKLKKKENDLSKFSNSELKSLQIEYNKDFNYGLYIKDTMRTSRNLR